MPSLHFITVGGGWVVGFEFLIFFQKWEEGSDFSYKKVRVGKIGGCFKKGGVWHIFTCTNPFQCYISLSVWCACVFSLFATFLSVFFVFHWKNFSYESNQQIYEFYKWLIFEKQSHFDSKFLISGNYSVIVIQIAAVST